jgi:hypothetical protein
VEYAAPVQLVQALDRGNLIDDPRGQQEAPGPRFLTIAHPDAEGRAVPHGGHDFRLFELDRVVLFQVRVGQREEVSRPDSVLGEKAVDHVTAMIPGLSRIADQDGPSAAAKYEGGAEAGGAAADDDNVVHRQIE